MLRLQRGQDGKIHQNHQHSDETPSCAPNQEKNLMHRLGGPARPSKPSCQAHIAKVSARLRQCELWSETEKGHEMDESEHLRLTFKSFNYATKDTFQDIPLKTFKSFAESLSAAGLKSGTIGIYVKPTLHHKDGREYLWPALDIEAKQQAAGHPDIDLNIQAAGEFLIYLREHGLADDLVILLTGSGFRFVWPYIIPPDRADAFLLWLKSCQSVDISPYTGRAFLRMFAYRGNRRQGKPTDVHVQRMPNDLYFWDLDAVEYRRLVSGRPDPSDLSGWLQDTLPSKPLPDAWCKHLDYWQDRLKLAQTIYAPKFPRARGEVNWSLIEAQLEADGITYREFLVGELVFWKLSTCPRCHRRDGNAFVTPSGHLKCHHENSCVGTSPGLPPWRWVEGYEQITVEAIEEPTDTIESARAKIAAAVAGQDDLLISSDPGSGKTTTTILTLVESYRRQPQLIMVSAPTLKLCLEIRDKLQALAPDVPVKLIEGRHGDGDTPATCHKVSAVESLCRRGFSPKMMACYGCSWAKKGEKNCGYIDQFKRQNKLKTGIVLTTTAQASLMLVEGLQPDVWVIDEAFRDTFLQTKSVNVGSILAIRSKLSPASRAVIDRMLRAANDVHQMIDGPWKQARLYATKAPAGPFKNNISLSDAAGIGEQDIEVLRRDLDFLLMLEDETPFQWQKRLLKAKVDPVPARWLCIATGSEPGTAYIKITKDSKRPIRFCYTTSHRPDFSGRMICLDGTAHQGEVEALTGRTLQHVDARLSLSTCKRVHIKAFLGKLKAQNLKPDAIEARLKECFEHLPPDAGKVLIATHMIIESQVLATARALQPNRLFVSCHFGASRGLNAFEQCDAVILFGTPSLNPGNLLDAGMALFADDLQREEWQRHLTDAEVTQTVHRARPIHGSKTIIVAGRTWPAALGTPDITLTETSGCTSTKVQDAVDRLQWFLDTFGFITRDAALLCGITNKTDKSLINEIDMSAINRVIATYQTTVPISLNSIYRKIGTVKTESAITRLSGYLKTPLALSKNYWTDLVARLTARNPNAGRFEVLDRRNWQVGIGDMTAAQTFLRAMNAPITADHWRARPPEPSENSPPDAPEKLTKRSPFGRKPIPAEVPGRQDAAARPPVSVCGFG